MGWSKQLKLIASFSAVLLFLPIGVTAASEGEGSLIPMGHSIGIKMDLSGVFLISDVLLAKEEWLKAGDLVEHINGVALTKIEGFEDVLTKLQDHEEVSLQVLRNGVSQQIKTDSASIKGLLPFLKDRTEGTGTLTYVDPSKKTYGALGHQIIDSSFNSPPLFKAGTIHLSEIEQIRKSAPGNPGYKISSVVKEDDTLGSIDKNGIYGIFGAWNDAHQEVLTEPVKIMHPNDVKVGNAEILTTVQGTKVESFSIEITKVEEDQFLFTVTDAKLLEKTGGILQGMSGSPVIQGGLFAGAVTHMFVDDPENGAALFLETMRTDEK